MIPSQNSNFEGAFWGPGGDEEKMSINIKDRKQNVISNSILIDDIHQENCMPAVCYSSLVGVSQKATLLMILLVKRISR